MPCLQRCSQRFARERLDWDEVREGFIERLRAQGAGVKVVIIRDRPCTLPPPEGRDVTVLTSAQVDGGVEAV